MKNKTIIQEISDKSDSFIINVFKNKSKEENESVLNILKEKNTKWNQEESVLFS